MLCDPKDAGGDGPGTGEALAEVEAMRPLLAEDFGADSVDVRNLNKHADRSGWHIQAKAVEIGITRLTTIGGSTLAEKDTGT
jgi:hypothetical protein